MKPPILLSLFAFLGLQVYPCTSQNLITNGSFEELSINEIGLAQGENLQFWKVLAGSPDLYNQLDNGTEAAMGPVDGDIFLQFLNCETIYQQLETPLIPGISYSLSFAYQTRFNFNFPPQNNEHLCTNLSILGAKNSMENIINLSDCISDLAAPLSIMEFFEAPELGYWNQVFWCFSPTDTIHYLGFGTEMSEECQFGVSIDNVQLNKVEPGVGIFADIFPDTLILCQPDDCIEISTPQTYSFSWSDGENGANREICTPGELTVSYNDGGCTLHENIQVSMLEAIRIFSENTIEICEGECREISLNINSELMWNDGTTDHVRTVCAGQYQIITTIKGCEITDELSLIEGNCVAHEIYTPNVFSPNFDGINDQWKLLFSAELEPLIASSQLRIFDRWGSLLHQSQNTGWDGKHNGKAMPHDSYVFTFQYQLHNNKNTFIKNGTITLIR